MVRYNLPYTSRSLSHVICMDYVSHPYLTLNMIDLMIYYKFIESIFQQNGINDVLLLLLQHYEKTVLMRVARCIITRYRSHNYIVISTNDQLIILFIMLCGCSRPPVVFMYCFLYIYTHRSNLWLFFPPLRIRRADSRRFRLRTSLRPTRYCCCYNRFSGSPRFSTPSFLIRWSNSIGKRRTSIPLGLTWVFATFFSRDRVRFWIDKKRFSLIFSYDKSAILEKRK